MTKLGRINKKYSTETKRYHIEQILKRRISVTSYAQEVGLYSMTIYRWLDEFSENKQMKKQKSKKPESSTSSELERLRMENAHLKVQLEDERLEREAYERMIVIAERTFNIPIGKKSGAKQSKK